MSETGVAQPDGFDIAIIGGGPIGLFSAFYASVRQMRVVVIEALDELGGQLNALYPEKWVFDVAGFVQVRAKDLAANLIAQASTGLLTTMTGARAEKLLGNAETGFTIACVDNAGHPVDVQTRTLLITSGVGPFRPNKLGAENEDAFDGKGLLYFVKNLERARNRRVVIVGGGDSALDWAQMLEPVASETHLIHRREEFRAQEHSVLRLRQSTTQLHLNAQVKAIRGNGKVESIDVAYAGGVVKNLPCDLVVAALGFKADLGAIVEWGLRMDKKHIAVNEIMETSVPGIYAAGDVVSAPGIGNLKLMVVGFGQGTIAVNSAKTRIEPAARLFPGHLSSDTPRQ